MDSKDLAAEVSLLLDQMEGEQGDRHEIYLRVRQLLSKPIVLQPVGQAFDLLNNKALFVDQRSQKEPQIEVMQIRVVHGERRIGKLTSTAQKCVGDAPCRAFLLGDDFPQCFENPFIAWPNVGTGAQQKLRQRMVLQSKQAAQGLDLVRTVHGRLTW